MIWPRRSIPNAFTNNGDTECRGALIITPAFTSATSTRSLQSCQSDLSPHPILDVNNSRAICGLRVARARLSVRWNAPACQQLMRPAYRAVSSESWLVDSDTSEPRNTCFWTFPVEVRGRTWNAIDLGALNDAR